MDIPGLLATIRDYELACGRLSLAHMGTVWDGTDEDSESPTWMAFALLSRRGNAYAKLVLGTHSVNTC
eukprot:444820-Amphidinium_carterae.1